MHPRPCRRSRSASPARRPQPGSARQEDDHGVPPGADGEFKIGFNEAAIGLPLPGVLLMLAADRLHEDVFEEATRGARLYPPREARTAGFLHRVVAPSELRSSAIAEAHALGALPPGTYRREKEARVGPIAERMRTQLAEDLLLIKRIGV